MTPQQIVGLAVRIFAIWLVIALGPDILRVFTITQVWSSRGGSGNQARLYFFFVVALYLVGILVLWFCPMVIAHRLVPRTKFQDTLRLPGQQAVTVACVVLGLWTIVSKALPSVTTYIAVMAFCIANGQPITTLSVGTHANGIVGFAQLVAGVLLVTKAHALTAWVMPLSDAHRRGR